MSQIVRPLAQGHIQVNTKIYSKQMPKLHDYKNAVGTMEVDRLTQSCN